MSSLKSRPLEQTQNRFDTIVLFIIISILCYSAILIGKAWLSGAHIGDWIWHRHQNQFSWYSRPLFIIPACYYAYKQKIGFVIGMMVLLGTSLFWFSPPAEISETISGYLDWERHLFFDPNQRKPLIFLSLAVILFLFLLFYAFWKRSFWIGLLVLNIGNLLKIAVSLIFGGDAGSAAIVPTLSSLLILNVVAVVIWKFNKKKQA